MNKSLSMADAVDSILKEEYGTVGDLKPGEPITKKIPCPKATLNKVKKPESIKGTIYDSSVERDLYNKGKKKKISCEEDEEAQVPDEEVREIVLQQFEGLEPRTTGIALRDLLSFFQTMPGEYSKSQIMRVLQNLINKKELKIDEMTKKLFPADANEDEEDIDLNDNEESAQIEAEFDSEDEESYITPEDITEDEFTINDEIINYFQNSTSGSVGGINLSQVVKDLIKETNRSKQEIIEGIKELMKDGTLKKGVTDGTILFNSISEEDIDNVEEEEGSISPITNTNNSPVPVMNQETPETLRAKGWTEIVPGTFLGPDGVQKYVITEQSNQTLLNKIMNYKDDSFEALCEEFSDDFNEIEGFGAVENPDDTDGLDEFEATDEIDIEDGDEEVTITLSKDECDILEKVLRKVKGEEDTEEDLVDDLATDEEATIDLMGDDDEGFDGEEDEDDEDFNFDFDEDEENIADEDSSGTYDAAFNDGAAKLKKNTPGYGNPRRQPIEGKAYKPSKKSVYDAAGRDGAAKMTKETPAFDKSGKPISSETTKKAGSKDSIFNL